MIKTFKHKGLKYFIAPVQLPEYRPSIPNGLESSFQSSIRHRKLKTSTFPDSGFTNSKESVRAYGLSQLTAI